MLNEFVFVCLDDILIFSPDPTELSHMQHVSRSTSTSTSTSFSSRQKNVSFTSPLCPSWDLWRRLKWTLKRLCYDLLAHSH